AALCPTDIAYRIIDSVLLILSVITTRTVRTGQAKLQLLLVVNSAGDIEPHRSHEGYDCAITGDHAGQLNGIVGFGSGRDDHGIGTVAAGRGLGGLDCITAKCNHIGTQRSRELDFCRIKIDSDYLAAGSFEKLDRKLTEQAKTDYRDGLANPGLTGSDALESNRP